MKRLTLVLLCLLALSAQGQQTHDCQEQAEHREFDFWLGQWRVTGADGSHYGDNHIVTDQKGCALLENWSGIKGNTGTSINYYSPGDQRWHQLWVDTGSSVIDIAGNITDGSMVMTGQIHYYGDAGSAPFRGRWTPLADGRVRQFFEQRDKEGNWQVWFEGFYARSPGS